MSKTGCPAREVLFAYHTGELPEASAEKVVAHVSRCPACQSTVKAFGDTDDSLIARLRRPAAQELHGAEPQCRELIERAKAIVPTDDASKPTLSNVAPDAGSTVARQPSTAGPPSQAGMSKRGGTGKTAGRSDPRPNDPLPTELFDTSPSSAQTLPAQLREYRILEKLGQGGMGAVYKALHTRLDKIVALKVLPSEAVQDAELVARFDREMKAVGKLDHPHIVRAMDAGMHEGVRFLVMEFIEGMDLGKIVQRCGPLRIADACEVIRQAALGLRHADEHALVHRDIKPSNLVLSLDGEVKILDLGLALLQADRVPGREPQGEKLPASAGDATATGRAMGTLDYMAPEQVRDSHSVDIRADIYSLGCTLYKLLTGQAPFSGSRYGDTFDKMMAHLNDPVPPVRQLRPDVPERLAAVLDRMVAKDRDRRYAKPSQVVDDLKAFCPGCDLVGLLARARRGSQSGVGASAALGAGLQATPKEPPARSPGALVHEPQAGKPRRPTDQGKGEVGSPSPSVTERSSPRARPSPGTPAPQEAETSFDPYYKWLSIPPEEQPPNHYRLLGTRLFEEDRDVIQNAAAGRSAHLRTFALGKHSLLSQRLLSEIEVAKVCLLTPEDKAGYDARLRRELAAKAAASPASAGGPDLEALARSQGDEAAAPAIGLQPTCPKSWSAAHVRGWLRRVPSYAWVAVAGAATAALLGVVIYVATGKGRVKIELSDPRANVEVKIDGDQIDIAGLKNPVRLSVGEHELTVTGPDYQACVQSFKVLRGDNPVLQVNLVPAEPKTGSKKNALVVPRSASTSMPAPAVAPFDVVRAHEHQRVWADYLGVPIEMTNSIGMKFVLIPPGQFDMGSTPEEIAWARDEATKDGRDKTEPWYFLLAPTEAPRHRVTISRPFYLGAFLVTQSEYQRVMGINPSAFAGNPIDSSTFNPPLVKEFRKAREECKQRMLGKDTSRYPVDTVSWEDAKEFCRRLDALPEEGSAGRTYGLPTEAQWEYACRAGTASRWNCGDDESRLFDVAWYGVHSGGTPHPVGLKQPNAWGMYDAYASLWQWCEDWLGNDYYRHSPDVDPGGPTIGSARAARGSPSGCPAYGCRSAARGGGVPTWRKHDVGFRVLCEMAWRPASGMGTDAAAGSAPSGRKGLSNGVPPGTTDGSQTPTADVRQKAETERQRAEEALELAERLRYATTIKSAIARIESGHYGGVPELLRSCKKEFRNWEWGYLMSCCPRPEWKLQANKGPICALAVTPDGKSFVSAGEDESLAFWDIERGARRWECSQQGPIRDVAIDPAGACVVARCGPRFVTFDARNGKTLHDSGDVGASALCLSGDGKRLYVAAQRGQDQPAISVYSTDDWKAGRRVDTERLPCCLAIGRDGRYLVAAEPKGEVTVYDAKDLRNTGKKRSPDGFAIKSLSVDSAADVFVFASQMYVYQVPLSDRRGGGRSFVHPQATYVAVDSDRDIVVSSGADGRVQFSKLSDGKPVGTIEQGGGIGVVVVMPQGGILTGDPQGMIRYWIAPAEPRVDPCVNLRGQVTVGTHVAFREDGKLLALQGWPADKIVLYDTKTWEGREYAIPGAFERLARFRPGTTQLAITFDDSIRLFETKDGAFQLAAKIPARGKVRSGDFDRSGKSLFVAYERGGLELLDTHALQARSVDFGDKKTQWIGATISPDGRRAAAMKRRQTCVQAWDTETGRDLYHIQSDDVRSVEGLAFSPDGRVLAVAGWPGILLLDAATGRRLGRLDGHTGTTPGLAFTPDGHRLLSASTDMSVRIWDWRAGQELLRLPNSHYFALDVTRSPDGLVIASTDSGPGGRARQALPWNDDNEERAGPLPTQPGDTTAKHNPAPPDALFDETKPSASRTRPSVAPSPKAAASAVPAANAARLKHVGREVPGVSNLSPLAPSTVADSPTTRPARRSSTHAASSLRQAPPEKRPVQELMGRVTQVSAALDQLPPPVWKRLEEDMAARVAGTKRIVMVGRVEFSDSAPIRDGRDVGLFIRAGGGSHLVRVHDDGWFTAVVPAYAQRPEQHGKDVLLLVSAYQYAPLFVPLPIVSSETLALEITMQRVPDADMGDLCLTLVDERGDPIAGAPVRLGLNIGCHSGRIPSSVTRNTRPDGTCVFQVPRGGEYRMNTNISGYLPTGDVVVPIGKITQIKQTLVKRHEFPTAPKDLH